MPSSISSEIPSDASLSSSVIQPKNPRLQQSTTPAMESELTKKLQSVEISNDNNINTNTNTNEPTKKIKKRIPKSKKQDPSTTSKPPTPTQLRLFQKQQMGGPLCISPEQSILNILRKSLLPTFQSPHFQTNLREIKDLFLKRDFVAIFGNGNSEYLKTYAAEYTSSRALCYHDVFITSQLLSSLLAKKNGRIMCLGSGCGSELLGLSAAQLRSTMNEDVGTVLHIQDFADYKQDVLEPLEETIRTKWGITTSRLKVEYSFSNVLDLGTTNANATTNTESELTTTLQSSHLVTSFFLLNELWTQSKSSTVKFLMNLVATLRSGTYFLVIDSAGSFSEVSVNGKGYMVYHLLDQIRDFEIVEQTDSKWYRFPTSPAPLAYPVPLNNIRYFMRLYRKK